VTDVNHTAILIPTYTRIRGESRDADGHLREDRRFEDGSRANEGDKRALKDEAGGEGCAREDFAMELRLPGEELEGRQPDPMVRVYRASVHSSSFWAGGQTSSAT
jgi:hypothetical protein